MADIKENGDFTKVGFGFGTHTIHLFLPIGIKNVIEIQHFLNKSLHGLSSPLLKVEVHSIHDVSSLLNVKLFNIKLMYQSIASQIEHFCFNSMCWKVLIFVCWPNISTKVQSITWLTFQSAIDD